MKKLLPLLFLLLLCGVEASARCLPLDGLVSIRYCGAIADDDPDDGPAIQASLDASIAGAVLKVTGSEINTRNLAFRGFVHGFGVF